MLFNTSPLFGRGSLADVDAWVAEVGDITLGYADLYDMAQDGSGNFYALGYTDQSGLGDSGFLVKFGSDGAVIWQRAIGIGNSIKGIAADSSGNVYCTGFGDKYLFKFNPDGDLVWQRELTGAATRSCAIDGSDNIYVCGSLPASNAGLLVKYDTTGAVIWQRTLASSVFFSNVSVDSSGNVYVAGQVTISGNVACLVAKYDASGDLLWQRKLDGAGNEIFIGLKVSSDGSIYAVGDTNIAGNTSRSALIAKYDTSGGLEWQRVIGASGFNSYYGCSVAPSGMIYAIGQYDLDDPDRDILIAAYSASGDLLWQRKLARAGLGQEYGEGIIATSSGVYVAGTRYSSDYEKGIGFLAKLPLNGRPVSNADWTFAPTSLTASTPTLTAATPSLTSASASLTESTPTLSTATMSLDTNLSTLG
jgi:hypothetical protein